MNNITGLLLVVSTHVFTSEVEENIYNFNGINRKPLGYLLNTREATFTVELEGDDNQVPEWLMRFHNLGQFDGVIFVDTRSRVGDYSFLASAITPDEVAVRMRDRFIEEMVDNIQQSVNNCNFGWE